MEISKSTVGKRVANLFLEKVASNILEAAFSKNEFSTSFQTLDLDMSI